jgi:hypothetical protein
MWTLIIYVVATGAVVLIEHGFDSRRHCENRATVWQETMHKDTYKVDCIPAKNEIAPKEKPRLDTVEGV